jgi:hypothetical protein
MLVSEVLIDNNNWRTFKGIFWYSGDWNSSSLWMTLFKLLKLVSDSLDDDKCFFGSLTFISFSLSDDESEVSLKNLKKFILSKILSRNISKNYSDFECLLLLLLDLELLELSLMKLLPLLWLLSVLLILTLLLLLLLKLLRRPLLELISIIIKLSITKIIINFH